MDLQEYWRKNWRFFKIILSLRVRTAAFFEIKSGMIGHIIQENYAQIHLDLHPG
jgi:hypothetical protein